MTRTTISRGAPGAPRRLADRIRSAQRQISDRAHRAADAHAQDQGWTVAQSTGRLGMGARTYHDPRFGTCPASVTTTPRTRKR